MESYKPFLQIALKHNFYSDGNSKDFAISLTSATNQALMSLGIMPRNTLDGISLYYSSKTTGLLANTSDKLNLDFQLELQNSDFHNITDLPEYKPGDVLKFTPDQQASESTILLQQDEALSEKEKNEKGLSFKPPFGLITIDLDPQTLNENGEIKMRNYEVRFKTREFYWRYFILKSSDSTAISDLSISAAGSDVSFSDSGEATLSNGAKAMMLKSSSPLELKERYNFTHSLNFLLSGKAATMNLPMPDGKTLQKENGEIYADIYVYL